MSHPAHREWREFPSYSITTVLRTFWFTKCTCISVLVVSFPGHPSTGHLRGPPYSRKDIRYSWGTLFSVMVVHWRLCPDAFPCRVIK